MHVVSPVQSFLMVQCKYQGEFLTSVIIDFDDRVNSYLRFCFDSPVNNVNNLLTPLSRIVGKIRDVPVNTLEKLLLHDLLNSR